MLCDKKECYICHKKIGLHRHHIYFGKDRKKSEEHDFTCYLCVEHHEGTYGVHGSKGKPLNIKLKKDMQRKYELTHDRKEFMAIIHKNYLWDDDIT